MTDAEFRKLSPFRRQMVLQRCAADRTRIEDFTDEDMERLRKGASSVASLSGKKPEDIGTGKESADTPSPEESVIRDFMLTVPKRYRNADIEGDFSSPFIQSLLEGQSGIILGGNGIGKTRLAWALAIQWKKAKPAEKVQIIDGAALLSEVKACEGDWYETVRRRYGESEHLIIDEIDKIKGSEADWMLLTFLINHRYSWERQTIVIGNCQKEELMRIIGQSSYSRLAGDGGRAYGLSGTDRRKNA